MVEIKNPRIAVNLTPVDSALLEKVRAALESRFGMAFPTTQIIRLALGALAKQEKVR